MLDGVVNPRRAPRVRTDLTIDVKHEGDLWQSVTRDFGPGGCSLVSYRPLVQDAPVELLLRSRKLKESLVVQGRVAWSAERKAGIAFVANGGGTGDPERWFRQLLGASPSLLSETRKLPDRLRGDEFIVRQAASGWRDVDLSTNELMLLSRLDDGASVRTLAARTQLADDAFARALFALLDKGVLEREAADAPN